MHWTRRRRRECNLFERLMRFEETLMGEKEVPGAFKTQVKVLPVLGLNLCLSFNALD